MSDQPAKPIWLRLPRESGKAYEGFSEYRDQGINRSLKKTARRLRKNKALMERWSVRWGWVRRAEAWDDMLDEFKLAGRSGVSLGPGRQSLPEAGDLDRALDALTDAAKPEPRQGSQATQQCLQETRPLAREDSSLNKARPKWTSR